MIDKKVSTVFTFFVNCVNILIINMKYGHIFSMFSLFSMLMCTHEKVSKPADSNHGDIYNWSLQNSECYHSDKINKLIPEEKLFDPIILNDADFKSLNAYEHFVHSFYFPEWYYQSCTLFAKDEDILTKIPANLRNVGEGLVMSKRQKEALIQNRDSSIILMKKCIEQTGDLSSQFSEMIIRLDAYELIPTILRAIENQEGLKDPYILTTLCIMMRFNYLQFQESAIYEELYPNETMEVENAKPSYNRYIQFTEKNYQTILDFSRNYFEYRTKLGPMFIAISSGQFFLGVEGHAINPFRNVEVAPFHISRFEITNRQFKQFIDNTGYITMAEKRKDAFVFRVGLDEFEWIQDSTANWRFPNGVTEGGIEDKMDHPVTCISFIDAEAYCNWANVRLPTFEEWEVASRGGQTEKRYFFGDSIEQVYPYANIWHGKTHLMIYEGEDAVTTAPVGSYLPNNYGIYDMYGNVFEFCTGQPESFKTMQNVAVSRGGSWWCSISACGFFNSVDIGRVQIDASFSNNGFRVVL